MSIFCTLTWLLNSSSSPSSLGASLPACEKREKREDRRDSGRDGGREAPPDWKPLSDDKKKQLSK
jgi:hypothetical protein